jgi:hypothetical protein
MRFHQKRIGTLAVWILIAAGGYCAGWWHHSHRSTLSVPNERSSAEVSRKSANSLAKSRGALNGDAAVQLISEHGTAVTGGEKRNPEASIRTLLADDKKAGGPELSDALGEWAREDPAAAFVAFIAEPRLQNSEAARRLFSLIGEKDPVAGLAMLAQLPLKPWSKGAAGALAAGWARKDPQAAAAAGIGLPPGVRRRQFLTALLQAWQQTDTVAVANWLKSLPEGESAQAIIGKDTHLMMGGEKTADQMSARLEIYRLAAESQKVWLLHEFMHWSGTKPDDACRWAFQLPAGSPQRIEIIEHAVNCIKNHEIALQLLSSVTDPKDRLALTRAAARAWSAREPEAAWQWTSTLADDAATNEARQAVREALISADPEKAAAFLQRQQPERLAAWGPRAAEAWAKISPDDALAWAGAAPAEHRDAVVAGAIQGMVNDDPGRAFGESSRIADEDARGALIRKTGAALATEDVTNASNRINAMPPGPDRDAAIQGLFRPAFDIEPDSALIWASAINDPSLRDNTVRDGFVRWLDSDAVAAEGWLARAALDERLRDQLSSILAARKTPAVP